MNKKVFENYLELLKIVGLIKSIDTEYGYVFYLCEERIEAEFKTPYRVTINMNGTKFMFDYIDDLHRFVKVLTAGYNFNDSVLKFFNINFETTEEAIQEELDKALDRIELLEQKLETAEEYFDEEKYKNDYEL